MIFFLSPSFWNFKYHTQTSPPMKVNCCYTQFISFVFKSCDNLIIFPHAFKTATIRGQVTSNIKFRRKRNIRRYIRNLWDDCSSCCLWFFVSRNTFRTGGKHSSKRGAHVYFWHHVTFIQRHHASKMYNEPDHNTIDSNKYNIVTRLTSENDARGPSFSWFPNWNDVFSHFASYIFH